MMDTSSANQDGDGKLQKTPTYEKLLERATRPTKPMGALH
jgi:hypothetical protein